MLIVSKSLASILVNTAQNARWDLIALETCGKYHYDNCAL